MNTIANMNISLIETPLTNKKVIWLSDMIKRGLFGQVKYWGPLYIEVNEPIILHPSYIWYRFSIMYQYQEKVVPIGILFRLDLDFGNLHSQRGENK